MGDIPADNRHSDRFITRIAGLGVRQARLSRRQLEKPEDSRSLNALECGRKPRDRVRDHAPLAVCGRSHRLPHAFAGQRIHGFHAITARVYPRIVRVHPFVDNNRAPRPEFEPRVLRERRIRPDADGQKRHIARDRPGVRSDGLRRSALADDLEELLAAVERDTVALHALPKAQAELAVEHCGQRRRQCVDDRDADPFVHETLDHLHADEPSADDHGVLHGSRVDRLAHRERIGHRPEREYAPQVEARQRRTDRRSARRQNEDVVRKDLLLAGVQVRRPHCPVLAVDAGRHMSGQNLHVFDVAEIRRVAHDAERRSGKLTIFGHDPAHIVGKTAPRVTHPVTLLEHRHVRVRADPHEPRRGLRAARDAADDHNPLRHSRLLLI